MSEELRSVRFKPEPGVAPGQQGGFPWQRGSLLDLLLAIPYWRHHVAGPSSELPSLSALNALLAKGRVDAGMSGGCEWKPFELTPDKYELLVDELLTDPRFDFEPT